MSSEAILAALSKQGIWWTIDPRYWLSTASDSETLEQFCSTCPCLEWIIAVLAAAGSGREHTSVLQLLRTLLFDTWSQLSEIRHLPQDLGDRVVAVYYQLERDFDPPLRDTSLHFEDVWDGPSFELALCLGGITDASESESSSFVETVLGPYNGLREIWSDSLLTLPVDWDPYYVAPDDRDLLMYDCFVDGVIRDRYRWLIEFIAGAVG